MNRERFHELWGNLPQLTVLSAGPGWGKTTWVESCREYREQLGFSGTLVTSRLALSRVLEEGDDLAPDTLYVDDVLQTARDPLWGELRRFQEEHPRLSVVVTALDNPPSLLDSPCVTFAENELAFTPEEIEELAQAQSNVEAPISASRLSWTAGHPALVRQALEAEDAPIVEGWSPPPRTPAYSLLKRLCGVPIQPEDSNFLRFVSTVSSLRTFTAELAELAGWNGEGFCDAQRYFDRLTSYPLGSTSIHPLSGEAAFEWSDVAWDALGAFVCAGPSEVERYKHGLRIVERADQPGLELYYLLKLGLYQEAEELANAELRRLLLATPRVTRQALLTVDHTSIPGLPNLLLLMGVFLLSSGPMKRKAEDVLEASVRAFETTPTESAYDKWRSLSRQAFAAGAIGDRAGAQRKLHGVKEIMGSGSDSEFTRSISTREDLSAGFAAELYVAYWASIQLGEYGLAANIVDLMEAFENRASPTHQAEQIAMETHRVFMGTDNERLYPLGSAHTDSLSYLELGLDAEAHRLVRNLAAQRSNMLATSANEALALGVAALSMPESLSVSQVEGMIRRNQLFWRDGVVDSFFVFSAALAFLAISDHSAVSRLERYATADDWFGQTAFGLLRIAAGELSDALENLARARSDTVISPRANAVSCALSAGVYGVLEDYESAAAMLECVTRDASPEVGRFALRFIPDTVFQEISARKEALSYDVAELMERAKPDRRTLKYDSPVRLTEVERETLILLRDGRTTQEIADIRIVSPNTVKTQLRTLYRKLGVRTRHHAVQRARERGYL